MSNHPDWAIDGRIGTPLRHLTSACNAGDRLDLDAVRCAWNDVVLACRSDDEIVHALWLTSVVAFELHHRAAAVTGDGCACPEGRHAHQLAFVQACPDGATVRNIDDVPPLLRAVGRWLAAAAAADQHTAVAVAVTVVVEGPDTWCRFVADVLAQVAPVTRRAAFIVAAADVAGGSR